MICHDFAQELDDYLDGRLDAERCERLLTHSLACRACNSRLALEALLRQRLRNLAPPVPPPDFAARMLSGARAAAHRHERRRGERRGSGRREVWLSYAALAASWAALALLLLPQQFQQQPDAQPQRAASAAPSQHLPPAPVAATVAAVDAQKPAAPRPAAPQRDSIRVVRVEQGQTESVKLVFRSPGALSGVTMELELPAGIQLVGYPGRSRLSWQTDLDAGANVLELPVQVRGAGGVVTATVDLDGDRRSFSVLVQGTRARAAPAPAERAT